MKFKTRLVVAFFTIILIPLVLSSALVCMVGKYQLSSIEKNYGIKNTTERPRRHQKMACILEEKHKSF